MVWCPYCPSWLTVRAHGCVRNQRTGPCTGRSRFHKQMVGRKHETSSHQLATLVLFSILLNLFLFLSVLVVLSWCGLLLLSLTRLTECPCSFCYAILLCYVCICFVSYHTCVPHWERERTHGMIIRVMHGWYSLETRD